MRREDFYTDTLQTVDRYIDRFPLERERLARLGRELLRPQGDLRNRKNIPNGHICSSAIILFPDRTILTLGHRKLGIRVVPGGHYDDTDGPIFNAALRETQEETGLTDLSLHPWHSKHGIPLDIDTHMIPPKEKDGILEGEHPHFDFRYVLKTDQTFDELEIDPNEVYDPQATPLDGIENNPAIAPSILPAIRKLDLLQ